MCPPVLRHQWRLRPAVRPPPIRHFVFWPPLPSTASTSPSLSWVAPLDSPHRDLYSDIRFVLLCPILPDLRLFMCSGHHPACEPPTRKRGKIPLISPACATLVYGAPLDSPGVLLHVDVRFSSIRPLRPTFSSNFGLQTIITIFNLLQ